MRIGILSLALHTNYGGLLQAYALQTVLERLGHDVVFLNKDFNLIKCLPVWKWPFSLSKRCIRKYLFHQEVDIFKEYHHNRDYRIISQYTQRFIDENIHVYPFNHFSDLKASDFDCIIVGSDQVWRKKYFEFHYKTTIDNAYLSFATDWKIKKVAYAASFGTEEWEYDENDTIRCKKLIQQFEKVSVREESGVHLLEKYFDLHAARLLDPTFLLNKDDYIQLFAKCVIPKSRGDLLCYFLDPSLETSNLVSYLSQNICITPFCVNGMPDDVNAELEKRIQPPLEAWIRGFYDAKFVVTDSFHACVFSIIFNKPFIVYGNVARGLSRIKSLLIPLGLEERIVSGINDIPSNDKLVLKPNCLDLLKDKIDESKRYLQSI